MEDDFDLETMRLKKLLEDNILKVERENLELIRNGNLDPYQCSKNIQVPRKQEPTSSSSIMASRAKRLTSNVKSAPTNIEVISHPQSSQCLKHSDSRSVGKCSHANVHFLNDLQSSLLVSNMKKRVLQNEVKSRYTPCAVPLSPPIRIRKEDNLSFSDQTPTLLNIHNSNHVSHTVLKKKLAIQNLPGITIMDEHRNNTLLVITENTEGPVPSQQFPLMKDFHQKASDSFSESPASSKKHASVKIRNDYLRNASDSFSKVRFESSENSVSFQSIDSNSSPDKRSQVRLNQSADEEHVPNKSSDEQKPFDDDANSGFNLHISLDSISTKDVINQFLQKVPEFITGLSTNIASAIKSSSTEEKNHEGKLQFEFEVQPNAAKSFKNISDRNLCVSTSTQTDYLIEQSQNQTVLRDLVKEVVVDTLKDIKLPEYVSSACRKIDSGIQSEIETDGANSDKNFQMQFPGNGVLLNKQNFSSLGQASVTSKGIQVSMNPIEILNQSAYKENCLQETSDSSDKHSDGNVRHYYPNLYERDNMMPERPFFPSHNPQKVELMLGKIYEHVCQEKELSHNYPGISQSCSIVTRDVAVQFNPLHTSTKSTLTSDIRRTDSSCQYDNQLEDISAPKSYTNTFVQATSFVDPSYSYDRQANAYTQCETKTFLDTDVQTEMRNSDYSATNTSVSSTPVSDSMFMDDLLSEGEVTLPWNLRLLSLSDRGGASSMNTVDSSDISTKEKDYSLSEGEIHPNIVHYLNICQNNQSEENDFHHEIYSSRQMVDSKLQSSPRNVPSNYAGYNFMCSANMHHHLSSSLSEGEMNSNTSLSLGKVPPDYVTPAAELSHTPDNFSPQEVSDVCDKFDCDLPSSIGFTQAGDTLPHSSIHSNISENELRASINTETNLPSPVLQTVYEETQATSY